jgi:hypothetical protein
MDCHTGCKLTVTDCPRLTTRVWSPRYFYCPIVQTLEADLTAKVHSKLLSSDDKVSSYLFFPYVPVYLFIRLRFILTIIYWIIFFVYLFTQKAWIRSRIIQKEKQLLIHSKRLLTAERVVAGDVANVMKREFS